MRQASDSPAADAGHAQRVVGFIGTVVRQLKADFASAWEATATLNDDPSVPFAERLKALSAQVEEAEAGLAAGRPPSRDRLRALADAAAGASAGAQALNRRPEVAAARLEKLKTAPLGERSAATRPLAQPTLVRNPARGGLSGGPEARLAKARPPFEAAHQFVGKALAYAEPRLSLVELAVVALEVPRPSPPWPQVKTTVGARARQAAMPPARMHWLISLTHSLHGHAEGARLAHVAVVQWHRAKGLMQEAEKVKAIAEAGPPARAAAAIESFDAGTFRASAFPIGHLHMTFRGVPLLQDLFPPPATTALPPAPKKTTGSLGRRA